jgi:hypothetical protein
MKKMKGEEKMTHKRKNEMKEKGNENEEEKKER